MRWNIAPKIEEEFKNRFPNINETLLQLLYNRGLDTQEKIDEFLEPDYLDDIHDPFLFSDMKKAVARIFAAMEKKEKILVHGDYDADGVDSSAIMMTTLKKMFVRFNPGDKAEDFISIYIPHREKEGYGMNKEAVEEFIKQKINLVITVDCGISNKDEIAILKAAGIEVVVTDHHSAPPELPLADAIINPKVKNSGYPFAELSGAGVAFKVTQALLSVAKEKWPGENWEGFEKWLLDFVALGTVADCMPLLHENRTLVKYGLIVLNKTQRVGLQKLLEKAGIGGRRNGGNGNMRDNLPQGDKDLNTYSISFQIAPRLNAAGRIDHANTAYELLVTDDANEAEALADQLSAANTQRQTLTDKIMAEAMSQIGEKLGDKKIIVVKGAGWPVSLVGLVAGKISDRYNLPVIVAGEDMPSLREAGLRQASGENKLVGSGRSIEGFDIMAVMQKLEHYFARYGGHPQACGFALKSAADYDDFKKDLEDLAAKELSGRDMAKSVFVEAEVKLEDAGWELYDAMEQMEPFGEGNRRPRFLARNLEITVVEPVGRDGAHLRLMAKNGGAPKKFIGFNLAEAHAADLKIGDKIDIVFEMGVNEWNGNRELQYKIVDIGKGNEE